MKIIFLTQTSGHHIEYLNHIFNEVGNFTNNQYIFILPESFHQNKDKFIWKENKTDWMRAEIVISIVALV